MKDFPSIPSKWYSTKFGVRLVIDRTLSNKVVYYKGNDRTFDYSCTLKEWKEYVERAIRLD